MDSYRWLGLYLRTYRLMYKPQSSITDISKLLRHQKSYLSKLENGNKVAASFIIEVLKLYNIKEIKNENGFVLVHYDRNELFLNRDLFKNINIVVSYELYKIVDDIFNLSPSKKVNLKIDNHSILLPFQILNWFTYRIINEYSIETNEIMNEYGKIISNLENLLPKKANLIYKIAISRFYHINCEYVKAKALISEVLFNETDDLKIKILCNYYLQQTSNYTHEFHISFKTSNELEYLFKMMPNRRREIQSLTQIAQTYIKIEDFEVANKKTLEAIELSKNFDQGLYAINCYNLAYNLSSHRKFDEAIIYYKEAIEFLFDNTTCFKLAWCYYKTGDNDNAKKYIYESRKATTKIYRKHSSNFCDWLEAMINKAYSKKCEEILLKIEKEYEEIMPKESKVLLYRLLRDHYLENDNYRFAKQYINLLDYNDF